MDWARGSHGSTFGGNPVSCAAANATLDLLEGGLVANAARVGAHLRRGLEELGARHPLVGDVRGIGLMQAIELVRDRETKEPARAEVEAVLREAFSRGLVLLSCGKSAIRFAPPLVVTAGECDRALSILDEALSSAERRRRRKG
jgi:4-aminobutyrate aminotransferase